MTNPATEDEFTGMRSQTATHEFAVFFSRGLYYFHPTDTDWLSANRNTGYSDGYGTEAEALAAAEEWEAVGTGI